MLKFWSIGLFILLGLFLIPAVTVAQGTVTVSFEPTYNGKHLKLSTKYYLNGHHDTLYIDAFRFYVSNIKFSASGGFVSYPECHIIDASKTASLSFQIDNAPAGNFTSLQFTVGVDSNSNTDGDYNGDLDTAKGMYSSACACHINAELDGRSQACKTPGHTFSFHICGYKSPYNAARQVTVTLPRTIGVQDGRNTAIYMKVDVARWLSEIILSKTNHVAAPGKEATLMADRYTKMFSVIEIR